MADESMADDTQQGEWQATTEDSHSPEEPAVGEWRECVDTDPEYLEIAAYCAFRAALRKYIMGTWIGDMGRFGRLPDDVKRVLEKLEEDKDAYAFARQLLHDRMGFDAAGQPERVLRYHKAYFECSDRSPFSRSAMLAGFLEVMDVVTRTEPTFRDALHQSVHSIHDTDYTNLVAAYTKWHDMAVASMKADGKLYANVTNRQLTGRWGSGKRALMEMRALLAGMRG
jgi:hypothetical protein